MKINEECIDHNVALICKELSCEAFEAMGGETTYTEAHIVGYIQGVCELADRLKEALKA